MEYTRRIIKTHKKWEDCNKCGYEYESKERTCPLCRQLLAQYKKPKPIRLALEKLTQKV